MVGEKFTARLTTTSKVRRPAKVAAASIVAILATRGAPASAAVARKTAAKSLGLLALEAAVVVLAVGVAGVLAWNGFSSSGNANAAPRQEIPRAVERPASTNVPSHAAAAPALPHPSGAKQAADHSTGNFGNPSSYELTVLAPTRVAVALAGGQSSVYLWQQPPAPTMTRHVKGRVLDAAGKPVAGAVVVIDERLMVMFNSLTGGGGAITNAAGEFDVSVHREEALIAVAFMRVRVGRNRLPSRRVQATTRSSCAFPAVAVSPVTSRVVARRSKPR